MNKKIIVAWLLSVASVFAAAPAPYPLVVDSQQPSVDALTLFQASPRTIRVFFRDGVTNATDISGTSLFMNWFVSRFSTNVVTSSWSIVSGPGGVADFTFSAAALNTNGGPFGYEVGITDTNGSTAVTKQGVLMIRRSPTTAGAGSISFTTNQNWGLINWIGLPNWVTAGSIGYGTNFSFSVATNFATITVPSNAFGSGSGVTTNIASSNAIVVVSGGGSANVILNVSTSALVAAISNTFTYVESDGIANTNIGVASNALRLAIGVNSTNNQTLAALVTNNFVSQGAISTNVAGLGVAFSNGMLAQGVINTNFSGTLGSNFVALASVSNNVLGVGASLSNSILAQGVINTNASGLATSNRLAGGVAATNLFGLANTNNLGLGLALSNSILAQGVINTNASGRITTNEIAAGVTATNVRGLGVAFTNQTLADGVILTNFDIRITSNNVAIGSLSTQQLAAGAYATNVFGLANSNNVAQGANNTNQQGQITSNLLSAGVTSTNLAGLGAAFSNSAGFAASNYVELAGDMMTGSLIVSNGDVTVRDTNGTSKVVIGNGGSAKKQQIKVLATRTSGTGPYGYNGYRLESAHTNATFFDVLLQSSVDAIGESTMALDGPSLTMSGMTASGTHFQSSIIATTNGLWILNGGDTNTHSGMYFTDISGENLRLRINPDAVSPEPVFQVGSNSFEVDVNGNVTATNVWMRVATAVSNDQPTTLAQVSVTAATFVAKAGGNMTGGLTNTFGYYGNATGLTGFNQSVLSGILNYVSKTSSAETMSGALRSGGTIHASTNLVAAKTNNLIGELIVNGSFSGDADQFSLVSASWDSGNKIFIAPSATASITYTGKGFQADCSYVLSFTVDIDSGTNPTTFKVSACGMTNNYPSISDGTYAFLLAGPTTQYVNFSISPGTNTIFLDDVSLMRVTVGDAWIANNLRVGGNVGVSGTVYAANFSGGSSGHVARIGDTMTGPLTVNATGKVDSLIVSARSNATVLSGGGALAVGQTINAASGEGSRKFIEANAYGSIAFGSANLATGRVVANGSGSMAGGFIGGQADIEASGQGSLAFGNILASSTSGIKAAGMGGIAFGTGAYATDAYSFVWSGGNSNTYWSHGIGSFNIKPGSDFYGSNGTVWVGESFVFDSNGKLTVNVVTNPEAADGLVATKRGTNWSLEAPAATATNASLISLDGTNYTGNQIVSDTVEIDVYNPSNLQWRINSGSIVSSKLASAVWDQVAAMASGANLAGLSNGIINVGLAATNAGLGVTQVGIAATNAASMASWKGTNAIVLVFGAGNTATVLRADALLGRPFKADLTSTPASITFEGSWPTNEIADAYVSIQKGTNSLTLVGATIIDSGRASSTNVFLSSTNRTGVLFHKELGESKFYSMQMVP